MNITFVTFAVIAVLMITSMEILKRTLSLPTAFTRRAVHIGAGCIGILSPLIATRVEIIIANLLFAFVLYLGRRTTYLSSIHAVTRHSYGEVYLPLGIALSALVFLPEHVTAFQFGAAIMGISDAVGGFVGEVYGKTKIPFVNIQKSLEGSFTFFITSIIISLFFVPEPTVVIVVVPLILSAVEAGLIHGLDNLALPIVAGGLFVLLGL